MTFNIFIQNNKCFLCKKTVLVTLKLTDKKTDSLKHFNEEIGQ